MAQIPRYETQLSPQSQPTVKLDNDMAGASAAAGGTEAMQQIAETSQKFYNLNALQEKTKATTNYKMELAQIESEASQDPDMSQKNLGKYQQRISEAQSKHAGTIGDGPTRFMATESFKVDGYNTGAKIDTNFKKKLIRQQEYNTYETITLNKRKYLTATDPIEKQKAYEDSLSLLEENVLAGVMKPEDAQKAREGIKQEWIQDEAYKDASAVIDPKDPQATVKQFEQNKADGKYAGVPQEELKKIEKFARDEADYREKKYKAAVETSKTVSAKNAFEMSEKGQLDYKMIGELEMLGNFDMEGGISKEYADFLRTKVSNPKKAPEERLRIYGELHSEWENYLSTAEDKDSPIEVDLDELSKFRDKVVMSGINDSEVQNFLDEISYEANMIAQETAEDSVRKETRKWYDVMGNWAKAHGDDVTRVKGELLTEFNKAQKEGLEPAKAAEKAKDIVNINNNPNRTKYSVGDPIETPMGTMYVWGYYDDGEPDVRMEKPRK